MTRKWISGFDGSAGTAVVTLKDAALWTDSRYFLAAADQLSGTPFRLMKDGLEETPTISRWLQEVLPAGSNVGIDGWVNTMANVRGLKDELEKKCQRFLVVWSTSNHCICISPMMLSSLNGSISFP